MKFRGDPGSHFGFLDMHGMLKKYLEKEQKEIFFHKKSLDEEVKYFNFVKFLFSDPGKV